MFQFGLSSHHVLWYVRCRYSPLSEMPGKISCWMPTVQMRLYSRAEMSGVRVGLELDPKLVFEMAPISQFWAMPSQFVPYGSSRLPMASIAQASPAAFIVQSYHSRSSSRRNP